MEERYRAVSALHSCKRDLSYRLAKTSFYRIPVYLNHTTTWGERELPRVSSIRVYAVSG